MCVVFYYLFKCFGLWYILCFISDDTQSLVLSTKTWLWAGGLRPDYVPGISKFWLLSPKFQIADQFNQWDKHKVMRLIIGSQVRTW